MFNKVHIKSFSYLFSYAWCNNDFSYDFTSILTECMVTFFVTFLNLKKKISMFQFGHIIHCFLRYSKCFGVILKWNFLNIWRIFWVISIKLTFPLQRFHLIISYFGSHPRLMLTNIILCKSFLSFYLMFDNNNDFSYNFLLSVLHCLVDI